MEQLISKSIAKDNNLMGHEPPKVQHARNYEPEKSLRFTGS